jgi:type IV pilus assembly protein PilY1
LAAIAALTPSVTWALDLVQSPPLPTSKSAYAAPNVIISIDDSGSMLYCSNYENDSGCPTTINNSSRTSTTTYSCASGYSADSSNPINCQIKDNTKRSVSYSCSSGYTLSGNNCVKNNKTDNNYRTTTYSCSDGAILNSSNNCMVIDNTKRIEKVTYTCGSGQYKNKITNDCYDTGNPTDESTPPWKGTTKRINVLKYALNNVFKDPELVPDGKIRLAWQSLNNTGGSSTRAGDVNSPTVQKTNTMRPLKGLHDAAGTHRNNFIKFVSGLNPSGITPSHEMFSQTDAYLRAALDKNGPWSSDPGGTGSKSTEYLGCRRNYHIMMTDGRWNGTPTDLPDMTKRDNATSLSIGGGAATYTGTDSALYRDESTGTTLADWAFYSWAQPLQTSGLSDGGKLKPSLAYEEAPDNETFGSGSNAVTLKKFWNPKYNPATWPHIITYTIGFSELAYEWVHPEIIAPTEMAPFGYDGSFPELAKGSITWPNLKSTTIDKNALDLWHAALNGRGRFYAIKEGEELETAFREIIGKINEESTALPEKISPGGTSSGYNTSQNNAGLFGSIYNAKLGWSGNVTATPAREPEEYDCPTKEDPKAKCFRFPNPIAEWGGKNTAEHLDERSSVDDRLILSWSDKWAGTKPTGGVAFQWATDDSKLSTAQKALLGVETTATGATVATRGENVLNFIRGDRSLEAAAPTTPPTAADPNKPFRTRTSRQGDIVNSEIWYTGNPISRTTLSGYSAFISTYKNRLPMLYVGGNDGMLHGFSAKDGKEKLAYVPRGVIADLKKLADPDYEHQYYVDGSPMTGDVKDGTAWKTMLVGTLGAGGKGYFVLDVTNPAGFSAASASTLVTLDRTRGNSEADPVCTSLTGTEKTACTNAVTENADIGNIVAQPVRNPFDPQETTQITRLNNGRWAVVLGNGYNSANQRPVLLMQYLDGDKELKRIQTTAQTTGVGNAKDNGLAAPALVDLDGDGKADVVYAGDNLGNLWKFDLTSDDDSIWAVAFGNNTPLFTARGPVAIGGARTEVQPITAPPIVRANDRSMVVGSGKTAETMAVGGMAVAFGTGRNLTSNDRRTDITQNVQTLYSVLDNTRYRKKSDKTSLEVHPGTGDCATKPDCVPTPAVVGTLSSAGSPLAKQSIADISELAGFQTLNATQELKKETWKDYKGWYLDLPGKGERLLSPMQFWDGSNILAVYTAAPDGTKSSSSDNINESCVDVKIDTSLGSQYRTLVNIMDGKAPSIPLVDANGDGAFTSADKNAARLSVSTGSPLLITTTKNIMDYTGVGADTTKAIKGARMPEQSMRPSWRQLK